jgi:acetamidase/formamidase
MSARTLHDVPRDAYAYVWDHAIPPALEVASGDEVLLALRDASDEQIHEDSDASAIARLDFDHVNPVSGPIFVKDARPGDVLAVEILEFSAPTWGWTGIIPGFGLLADEFPDPWLRISRIDAPAGRVHFGEGITLPLAPFTGTIGVAPAEPGEHPVLPPTRSGGNIDTRHLVPGTTLLLPVRVDGALLSAGDSHAAQGDGEVCGTAIESRMDVTVRVSVRRDLRLDAPGLEIPAPTEPAAIERGGWDVLTGVGPDLMECSRDAVRAAISFLEQRRGLERQEAYALCSVAADLRIHEIVDAPNWVVGCWVPRAVFDQES